MGGVLDSDKYGDKFWEMQQQMQANVSRFAAYKAHKVTNDILEHANKTDYEAKAKQIMAQYNRYQVAEYNTAVARSRTAKQWTEFNEDELKNELYPNIQWLPSSSADPREEHKKFYGLVLPKPDPFWNTNYPGNLWNCKCDWIETDKPASKRKVENVKPHNGLGGNPAKDKVIFTDEAGYFKMAPKGHSINKFYIAQERIRIVQECDAPGKIFTHSNLFTQKYMDSKKAYRRLAKHCFDDEQIKVATALPHLIKDLKNPKKGDLGENKDMGLEKNKKNMANKTRRGVVAYITYDLEVFNTNFIVFMEQHRNGFEQLYAVYKKKTRNIGSYTHP